PYPSNRAPRLVQKVAPFGSDVGSFAIWAKFDNVLNRTFQIEGVEAIQDDKNFVRCEIYYAGVRAAGGDSLVALLFSWDNLGVGVLSLQTPLPSTITGSTPLSVRLDRIDSTFTESYSTNGGTNWTQVNTGTHTMNVDSVAVYAATADSLRLEEGGNPPALTCLIDYFRTEAKIQVRANVLLEGPFNTTTNLMEKSLNVGGILSSHFTGASIPSEAVDSITIEIRDSASAASSTVRKFRPAWLLTDGSIKDFVDTTKNYVEFDTTAGNYYIVVRHRNHLAIMSATSQTLTGTTTSYNFTTAQGQAYGTNPMKQVAAGRFAMYAGDGNGDGGVDAIDRNTVWRPQNGSGGYLAGDFTLDGGVDAIDRNTMWRPNNGIGTQVP
ncbi:MAG: hypothetical protein AAB344_06515, partial [Bacteroidota bacterium]